VWLFPSYRWHTANYPVTTKVVWLACREAAVRAGLGHDLLESKISAERASALVQQTSDLNSHFAAAIATARRVLLHPLSRSPVPRPCQD